MNPLPRLAILLLTYNRTAMALRTIQSTIANLIYPRELISFYVADDGSDVKHVASIISLIQMNDMGLIGYHNEKLRHPGQEDTYNAGLGWNKGLGLCHQYSDFVLVLEDDWELDEPLDLVPYIQLLQAQEEIGICTFRILSTGADVHTVGHDGKVYLRYDRTTQYAYSGNPHIRHARYTKFYGWYREDCSPGEIELKQDDQYRLATDKDAPQIWRPLDISIWGAWKHIGSEKTWK